MKTNFIAFALLFFTIFAQNIVAQVVFEPVNPKTTKEAKTLLKTLYTMQGKYVLTGQHNYGTELTRSSDTIKKVTGVFPVIWGCDFAVPNRKKMIAEAINQAKKGSIITLMYHMNRPFDADTVKRSPWKELSEKEWQELVTPKTIINKQWQANIDSVAIYLKQLQDLKIPVLWRPYHEMNGIWFWWGNHPGKAGFKKLWIMTYDRFVNYHGLNNLIWVWNANAPRDWKNDQAYAYDQFYPGNEYVDVLAADIYKNDYKQSHHDQLVELGKGKLIALGEVGVMPTPEILAQQTKWSWFMCWANFPWTNNTHAGIKNLYSAPLVLSLENKEDKIKIEKLRIKKEIADKKKAEKEEAKNKGKEKK